MRAMTSFEALVRGEAPLLDAYLTALDADAAPFTIPGHKRNPLFGRVVGGDVPLHGGLDAVPLSGGLLAEAERRAAALWGADVARFSVAGSTHGNQAMALAVEAGRECFLAGRMPKRAYATASSPQEGIVGR